MEKKPLDKKLVKKYWQEVRRRAWNTAMSKSGMNVLIPVLAVLLGAIGLAGIPVALGWMPHLFFKDNLVANSLVGMAQMIVSVSLLTYFYVRMISEIPPQMHEELGGFIENPFDLDVYHSKSETEDDNEDEDVWASLLVKNNSASENIEECYLKLTDIVDLKTGKSVIEDVQKLTWSGREQNKTIEGNQPLRVIAADDRVCDVARTSLDAPFDGEAYYTTWFGAQIVEKGEYLLHITAYGNFKGHPIHYPYQAKLSFSGWKSLGIERPVPVQDERNAPTP